jgi:hypothetical protein
VRPQKPFEVKLELGDGGVAQWTVKPLQDLEADLVLNMTLAGESVRDIRDRRARLMIIAAAAFWS